MACGGKGPPYEEAASRVPYLLCGQDVCGRYGGRYYHQGHRQRCSAGNQSESCFNDQLGSCFEGTHRPASHSRAEGQSHRSAMVCRFPAHHVSEAVSRRFRDRRLKRALRPRLSMLGAAPRDLALLEKDIRLAVAPAEARDWQGAEMGRGHCGVEAVVLIA